ncbi:MAG: hypothetical protein ACLR6J_01375 [Parabacteroides merdae]
MKGDILIFLPFVPVATFYAEEITVKYLRYAGPYEIKGPFIVDSLDVNSKKFTDAELLKTAIPSTNVRESNRTLDTTTYSRTQQNSSVSLPPSI